MREVKEFWNRKVRTWDFGDEGQPQQRRILASVGTRNFLDNGGVYQPVSLDFQPSLEPGYDLFAPNVGYEAHFALDGSRRFYPDRHNKTRWLDLPSGRVMFGKTFTQVGMSLVWASAAYEVHIVLDNDRVKLDVVLNQPPPSSWHDEIEFDVASTGFADQEILAMTRNLKAIDSTTPLAIERPLSASLAAGVLTLGFDLTGMTYPVRIDPTTYEETASGDDTDRFNTTWSNTATHLWAGSLSGGEICDSSALFNITDNLSGATISDARYRIYVYTLPTNDATTDLFAELAAAPAAPTSNGGMTTALAAGTTARVAWNAGSALTTSAFNPSPNIATVIQELADAYSPNPIQILHEDMGSVTDGFFASQPYDNSAATAPELEITYMLGGAVFVPKTYIFL